jgi:hypothetical protein
MEKDTSFLFRTQTGRKKRMQELSRDLTKRLKRRVSVAEILETAFDEYEAKWRKKVSGN